MNYPHTFSAGTDTTLSPSCQTFQQTPKEGDFTVQRSLPWGQGGTLTTTPGFQLSVDCTTALAASNMPGNRTNLEDLTVTDATAIAPPTAPHPLASDSAYKNEILFDPPDLGTCHSLTPYWSSTHDLSYSQFKAVTDAISYPSPQSNQVFPSSPCDAAAPYLVLPLG
ncbi:hypothetical protein EDB83DRAFT_2640545 [Lactarius deliciosus]|nr:hypothetical protein EDB83DRAFT_2640545 [Lactarius deliciosus]